jgi:hypothetical protein
VDSDTACLVDRGRLQGRDFVLRNPAPRVSWDGEAHGKKSLCAPAGSKRTLRQDEVGAGRRGAFVGESRIIVAGWRTFQFDESVEDAVGIERGIA